MAGALNKFCPFLLNLYSPHIASSQHSSLHITALPIYLHGFKIIGREGLG